MTDDRPDPATFLRQAKEHERRQARGKLKIFFGAAPGVGKTYAMLEEARRLFAQGGDVVIGYVEPHRRAETSILLLGLEILAPKEAEYRGAALQEFDLAAALARRPAILIVDELAHTNIPGSRHPKRYQDVQALLDAGLDVFTTLNVQHLESLNDVVEKITGVTVRETIPDSMFDEADEVELVDLPPDALLERLREGKVYIPEVARTATESFFRKGNLTALRELALRRTAQWVDAQMHTYRREHGIAKGWPASERILVGIGDDALSAQVLRAAARLALGLRADLIAAYVETPIDLRAAAPARERLLQTLRLAESLGAETVTLHGLVVSEEILKVARSRNVSKVVIGKSRRPRWLERWLGSTASEVIRESGELDVVVVQGEEGGAPATGADPSAASSDSGAPARATPRRNRWRDYGIATTIVLVVTALATLMVPRVALANVVMVYLLGVIVASVTCGRGASIFASVLSVAAFDFFFVPPALTFAISDSQYLITFAVMLIVALLSSNLTHRIREQAEQARARERRTAALYSLSRELAAARSEEEVIEAGARHLRDTFDVGAALLLPGDEGKLSVAAADRTAFQLEDVDMGAAQWAFERRQIAGRGTATLPAARALYFPLFASQGNVGSLGVKPRGEAPFSANQIHQMETFVNQIALALERTRLIRETQQSQLRTETERLRNALLTSVSHDLRTPLSVITGAAGTLLESGAQLDDPTRRSLAESIVEEGARLNQIISNLVFATRLESGTVQPKKDWIAVEEIVGSALRRMRERLRTRALKTYLSAELPLVRADAVLLELVIVNLLENAIQYTPEASQIEISAWKREGAVVIEIADHGPGLRTGEEQRVFERFYRGAGGRGASGLGLGLYICRGIVEAHRGRIWSENRPGGGASFLLALPLDGPAPGVPAEANDDTKNDTKSDTKNEAARPAGGRG